jgi:hypothetical protein
MENPSPGSQGECVALELSVTTDEQDTARPDIRKGIEHGLAKVFDLRFAVVLAVSLGRLDFEARMIDAGGRRLNCDLNMDGQHIALHQCVANLSQKNFGSLHTKSLIAVEEFYRCIKKHLLIP